MVCLDSNASHFWFSFDATEPTTRDKEKRESFGGFCSHIACFWVGTLCSMAWIPSAFGTDWLQRNLSRSGRWSCRNIEKNLIVGLSSLTQQLGFAYGLNCLLGLPLLGFRFWFLFLFLFLLWFQNTTKCCGVMLVDLPRTTRKELGACTGWRAAFQSRRRSYGNFLSPQPGRKGDLTKLRGMARKRWEFVPRERSCH